MALDMASMPITLCPPLLKTTRPPAALILACMARTWAQGV